MNGAQNAELVRNLPRPKKPIRCGCPCHSTGVAAGLGPCQEVRMKFHRARTAHALQVVRFLAYCWDCGWKSDEVFESRHEAEWRAEKHQSSACTAQIEGPGSET